MLWKSGKGRGKVPGEPNARDLVGGWPSGQGRASLREGELSMVGDTQKVRGVLGAATTEA